VGKKSGLLTGAVTTLPGRATPGQRTISGTRIPPSYIQPLPARSGRLEVGEPSLVERPPLSLVKTTSVSSRRPRSSSACSTRPTARSIASIIPA
jgi:hypothetical protein